VSVFVSEQGDNIARYRLVLFGYLRPNITTNVRDLFGELLYVCGGVVPPCFYIEQQYLNLDSKSKVRLQGETYDALVLNRARWQIMCELAGIPYELVRPNTWQSKILQLKGKSRVRRATRKQMAQRHVAGIFGIQPTQDEADTICIGLYAIGEEQKRLGMFCRVDPKGAPKKGIRWK
jgi:hypothetical protein